MTIRTQAVDALWQRFIKIFDPVPGKIPTIEVYDLRANLHPNVEVTSNVTS